MKSVGGSKFSKKIHFHCNAEAIDAESINWTPDGFLFEVEFTIY